jgi:CDP-diacylglycerol--glycerol-3-phosphate 3-phosphatidyltransferase
VGGVSEEAAVVDVAPGPQPQVRRRPWIANGVTFLRAVLVPPILVLLAVSDEVTGARWAAFAVFVVAALTDTLDGWAARRWQGVTPFGAFADPVADKLLIVGTLVSLAFVGELGWWVVMLISARELLVTLLRLYAVRRTGVVVSASMWGKVKTVAQIVAVGAVILPLVDGLLVDVLLVAAVVLTVGSGADYVRKVRHLVISATTIPAATATITP